MAEYTIARSNKEIDDLLNKCADAENDGRSKYPGMTYEQGINYAIQWLLGELEEHPLE